MTIHFRIVSRLLILGTLVVGVVLLQPKPAFAGCFACRAECNGYFQYCTGATCDADYQACLQECGC